MAADTNKVDKYWYTGVSLCAAVTFIVTGVAMLTLFCKSRSPDHEFVGVLVDIYCANRQYFTISTKHAQLVQLDLDVCVSQGCCIIKVQYTVEGLIFNSSCPYKGLYVTSSFLPAREPLTSSVVSKVFRCKGFGTLLSNDLT